MPRSLRAVFLIAAIPLFGSLGCSHLFYQPSPALYTDPRTAKIQFEQVGFKSADGTQLYGWYFPAVLGSQVAARGTIIQFHGNAENMSSHFKSLVWVTQRGYNFFTFDYRGYGKSEGSPSQQGVNQDALAAIQYVLERDKASKDHNIVLYGQSLGGAILLRALDDLADRSRIQAVVADSTFYSYRAMGRDVLSRSILTWPLQPLASVLVSDSYSPEKSIPRVAPIPLLVIHGESDTVVPPKFGAKIYELAQPPKMFWSIPGGGHIESMDIDSGKYRDRLITYLQQL